MIEKEEWIGKKAKILYCDSMFEGIIVDETKNTVVLQTTQKKITIIKQNATITIDGKKITKKINKRPHDRLKIK